MTIGFPFPVWGYVYDSSGDLVDDGIVTITGDSGVSDSVDSSGRYIINIMDYASSGDTITITGDCLGETYSSSFKIITSNPGKNLDINLQEAVNPNNIYINTHHKYGNELYIFTPYDTESWCKTSDY